MDRAAYLRGRYLTSYAQCEFLLADLSIRVDNRFRYALEKRINAAKAMAEGSGPLNAYADDFLPLIENIGMWSERRHWLAHVFMTIHTAPDGKHAFEFRRYEQREDCVALLQWFASIDDLQNSVDAINRVLLRVRRPPPAYLSGAGIRGNVAINLSSILDPPVYTLWTGWFFMPDPRGSMRGCSLFRFRSVRLSGYVPKGVRPR